MRKEPILLLHKQEKHLANIVIKLSNISKHSKLMLTELRYQVKIHTISNRPRDKKNPANSPNFFFFKKKKKKNKKEKRQNENDIIYKARSNLMMPIQKNSRSTCFFCLPQQVPAMLSQENRGHNKLVHRLHSKHTNITSKSASNQT